MKLHKNFEEYNYITIIFMQKLQELHSILKINHGSFDDEYPEQVMSILYIKPDDIVLELGGNIGRNSCIIASLLNNSKNLLVIETDNDNVSKLRENRDLNNLQFFIEDAALSKTELIQKGWNTKPKESATNEEMRLWKPIKTISWQQLNNKYNLIFDTLVADCEGALYYILRDEPTFLENFKKIIIENDFTDHQHKDFVDNLFKKFNFKTVYTQPHPFAPNHHNFYEVWMKNI